MPVGPFTMVATYLTAWWIVLFMILPLGSSDQTREPPTDGSQWGAPHTPNLKRKFITTTWVSALVWVFIMLLLFTGWVQLPTLGPTRPL